MTQAAFHGFTHKCGIVGVSERFSDLITAIFVRNQYTVYAGHLTANSVRSEHLADVVYLHERSVFERCKIAESVEIALRFHSSALVLEHSLPRIFECAFQKFFVLLHRRQFDFVFKPFVYKRKPFEFRVDINSVRRVFVVRIKTFDIFAQKRIGKRLVKNIAAFSYNISVSYAQHKYAGLFIV